MDGHKGLFPDGFYVLRRRLARPAPEGARKGVFVRKPQRRADCGRALARAQRLQRHFV